MYIINYFLRTFQQKIIYLMNMALSAAVALLSTLFTINDFIVKCYYFLNLMGFFLRDERNWWLLADTWPIPRSHTVMLMQKFIHDINRFVFLKFFLLSTKWKNASMFAYSTIISQFISHQLISSNLLYFLTTKCFFSQSFHSINFIYIDKTDVL